MSYSNSCFSEYLGCQIYESIGVLVQKNMLGTYTVKGKEQSAIDHMAITERFWDMFIVDALNGRGIPCRFYITENTV